MRAHRNHEPKDPQECITQAESILGYSFRNKAILEAALTHPSAIEEGAKGASYERLEFLGDSIVGMCVAEEIFQRFPDLDEGGLTRIKVSLVSGSALSSVAKKLQIDEAIIFGPSEKGTNGRGLTSAMENVYEALTAALFLDGGLAVASEWVLSTLSPLISHETACQPENPKSSLQEVLQAKGDLPAYRIIGEEGPPHDRTFTAEVFVKKNVLGSGKGQSKKEAESAAAQKALDDLG